MSYISQQVIMEDNKYIKSFIRNFKGGQGDEEDFVTLTNNLDDNRLAIPTELQVKIDDFVERELAPMVYEPDIVFAESNSAGTTIDGIQYIDTDEDAVKMMSGFLRILIEVEQKWDDFAELELKPYLV